MLLLALNAVHDLNPNASERLFVGDGIYLNFFGDESGQIYIDDTNITITRRLTEDNEAVERVDPADVPLSEASTVSPPFLAATDEWLLDTLDVRSAPHTSSLLLASFDFHAVVS